MCGRYTRNYTWEQIHAQYSAFVKHMTNLQPRANICPTTQVDAIVLEDGRRTFQSMRWGLIPSWFKPGNKQYATFNARAETVDKLPTFRTAFKSRRCIIPASGYYEWQTIEGDKPQPWYFTSTQYPIISIAGIWDEWTNPQTGEAIKSCSMIITEPNQFVAEVHDRMPVLLGPNQFDAWLSARAGKEVLVPAAEDALRKWPVSKRVNSSRAPDDDLTLFEPIKLAA